MLTCPEPKKFAKCALTSVLLSHIMASAARHCAWFTFVCVVTAAILNWVDLLAIVPFYFEVLVGAKTGGKSVIFRVIRLVRVFRVFKISRYVAWIKASPAALLSTMSFVLLIQLLTFPVLLQTFVSAMMLSAWPLGMLLFVMVIGCIVFSSLMYYAERGTWDDLLHMYMLDNGHPSQFQSIPDAFYWCIITMCTVGYGDVVPVTSWGRFIAGTTSIMGVMVRACHAVIWSAMLRALV